MKIKHIIIVGFKHIGKSAIGRVLARELDLPFVDIDEVIMDLKEGRQGARLSCAEIVLARGEKYFRDLETKALKQALENRKVSVIAGGGGVAMREENRKLMREHTVINLTAPKGGVFERIMMNGKPSFFPDDEEPFAFFQKLWAEREPVFKGIATYTINNIGTPEETVMAIKDKLISNNI